MLVTSIFLLFPPCFQKVSFSRLLKVGIVWLKCYVNTVKIQCASTSRCFLSTCFHSEQDCIQLSTLLIFYVQSPIGKHLHILISVWCQWWHFSQKDKKQCLKIVNELLQLFFFFSFFYNVFESLLSSVSCL